MYLGVDYYPEYWPIEQIEEDINGIASLGANMVRTGEFAWHLMESQEGQFDFSFYDNLLPRLEALGLNVMFGTPTATFPAWLAKKHPDILAREKDGTIRSFGGRRQYCYNSEKYVQYASRITMKLVQHFAKHPLIVSWQIDNEFGHEGSDCCYCANCHKAFHRFLEQKYESITQLNETYGTIFWGQTYNTFSEVPMPTHTITVHNPSLLLDWSRFRSYSVNHFAQQMVDIVRQYKGEHQTVTHNFPGGFFDNKWYDYASHAQMLDFASYDNYPVWGGLARPIKPAEIAMGHDFMRGLKQQNFWIVEQLMGAQGHDVIGYLPRPNQAKMWSFQAFAHGCQNMLYFNWKAMTKGAEQFCMGIIDHDNVRGQKYEEVKRVFSEVKPYEQLLSTSIESQVAILYDYDNIWSWRIQKQSESFDFKDHLLSLYEPFFNRNVSIDLLPIERDFTSYKVVVVPAQQIMTEERASRLKQFVEQGGVLILSFRTALRDEHNNIHYGSLFPAFLDDLAGVVVKGVEALSTGDSVKVTGELKQSLCTIWRDLLEPTTAKVHYHYDDNHYPYAALTENKYGQGTVYYLGTQFEASVLDALVSTICEQQQIAIIESPADIEIVQRRCNNKTYLFILNHSDQITQWQSYELQPFESKIVCLEEAEH
jgi:beta-galactosidase